MVTVGCFTPQEVHEDVEISLAALERRVPQPHAALQPQPSIRNRDHRKEVKPIPKIECVVHVGLYSRQRLVFPTGKNPRRYATVGFHALESPRLATSLFRSEIALLFLAPVSLLCIEKSSPLWTHSIFYIGNRPARANHRKVFIIGINPPRAVQAARGFCPLEKRREEAIGEMGMFQSGNAFRRGYPCFLQGKCNRAVCDTVPFSRGKPNKYAKAALP
jgi:hypothetical protein